MPIHNQSPPQQKPKLIILSIIIKPIVMLFILSTFLFIGIAAVSTVLLLLAGSSLHLCPRRRHQNHRPRSASTLSVEELQHHLPQFNYDSRVESSRDCSICLECFEERERCRRLPDCNHIFHVNCVDSWLSKVRNCPICRSLICFDSCASSSAIRQNESDDYKLWWAVGI